MSGPPVRIDGLQYCNWSRERFLEMRGGGLHAAHVTVAYHENFRETAANLCKWNDWLADNSDLIMPGRFAEDVDAAKASGRTAIFFGFQNCSPMEDDIRLLELLHSLGARFMQLTYNNQTLLAGGCCETTDSGLTRMGREVVAEMNRLGIVVDMSHSGERSTLEAAECSRRPIAITHANPLFWHESRRGKSEKVLRALNESGGMLGLSLYPLHLRGGGECALQSFCDMAAKTAEIVGAKNLGIGSDLCRGHGGDVLRWMRAGRWTKKSGDGAEEFPPQPPWFESAADFDNLHRGLRAAGFDESEVGDVLGENWLRFFRHSFPPSAAA